MENRNLKLRVEDMTSQVLASSRFLEESLPKFPKFDKTTSAARKFEMLQEEYQKMEQQLFKTKNVEKHLRSQLEFQEKQIKNIQAENKKLRKQLDEKDIELMKTTQRSQMVGATKKTGNDVILKIQEQALKDNIGFIRQQMTEQNVQGVNEKIEEVLTVISDICYGSQFIELNLLFGFKSKDFSRLKEKTQIHWQDSYDDLILTFMNKKLAHVKFNEYIINIDE